MYIPEISKCVNDDTKNEVENNNDHNKVEEHVIQNPKKNKDKISP